MSSMSKTIKRQMARNDKNDLLLFGRVACPKCGRALHKRTPFGRGVKCHKCGFEGKMK